MKQKNQKYSIGLDIGTNSVGWAVTDENYNLLKLKGRNMWGVRLFDKANTAADRRNNRSIRRRYNKRRERIQLLRLLMNEMINEVDKTFFLRMSHTTFLDKEDKGEYLKDKYQSNYNLFVSEEYNDQDFYRQFPSIYHLREYLCTTKEKVDPRLIYLALHHIVKYRGNFLYENQNFSLDNNNIHKTMCTLLDDFCYSNEIEYSFSEDTVEEIFMVFKQHLQKKVKVENILNILKCNKEHRKSFEQLFTGVVGNSFNVTKMFIKEKIVSNDKDIKLKFSDANYENNLLEYANELNDNIEIIELMSQIYSWVELQNILGYSSDSMTSISHAMVERYKKHHTDLEKLKRVIKAYCFDDFNKMFRDPHQKNNYYNYIFSPTNCSVEDFYKYVEQTLKNINSQDVTEILNDIKMENFLLKQNSRINGNIPYQMQLFEMEQIIDNQKVYYPDLANARDRIIKILTFKIPYYYGPLDGNDKFGWLVKKSGYENERILPWNHEEVVDVNQTAESFIKKLTNFCTYLPDQPVMPKCSLLQQKYEVLAELNQIRVNKKPIGVDIKNQLITDLFKKVKTVTDKKLRQWFINNQVYLNNENLEITGYQKENAFSSSLSSWVDFSKIFDNPDFYIERIEKIIYYITIFEDKNILRNKLKSEFNDLTNEQMKKILSLRYSGWGRLSEELLYRTNCDNRFGSSVSIIDVMELSHLTFMEIINDKDLGFCEIIDKANFKEKDGKFHYYEVDELVGSPAIKKGIWQSLKIVEELTKIMKNQPAQVYIEFAREEGQKKRTTSSLKKLLLLYENLNLNDSNEKEVFQRLKKENVSNKVDSERLYLYYTQMGKCMYSGKSLDIDSLNLYQIDHIVPQSLIKDDSLDNKVLVISDYNQRKLDDQVVPREIREHQEMFWKYLFNNKLISPKKHYSLMKAEFSDKDKEKFINRQLVETRQIIKHVARIINEHYDQTKVFTIRANMSHDFRTKYEIIKSRNVNDYHHAHDAYISCLLGTYIQKKYPQLEAKYIYGEYLKYIKDGYKGGDGFILNSMNKESVIKETGEVIWLPDYIKKIKKCFYYKDCYVTKKLESNDSSLFNMTILPGKKNHIDGKGNPSVAVNKERGNVEKYGGFSGVQYSIAAINGIKHKKTKDEIVRKLTKIPLYLRNASDENKIQFIKENESLDEVTILLHNILVNQLIEIDNGIYYVSSATELVNARQLVLNEQEMRIISFIEQAINRNIYDDVEKQRDKILGLYQILINKIISFYPSYNDFALKLKNREDDFEKLSCADMCYVIVQILTVLHANASNGNISLKDFNISSRIGRLGQKNIKLNESTFIQQSITGIYTHKLKL